MAKNKGGRLTVEEEKLFASKVMQPITLFSSEEDIRRAGMWEKLNARGKIYFTGKKRPEDTHIIGSWK